MNAKHPDPAAGVPSPTPTLPSQPATERLAQRCAQIGTHAFTARGYGMGSMRHIVLLRFANDVPESGREGMIERFLRLKDDCRRDAQPYIRSIEYGRQESGEGNALGFEHAFLMTFDSEGDRNFYVGEPIVHDPACYDPVHHAFKAAIGPMLAHQGALVFDFFPGAR